MSVLIYSVDYMSTMNKNTKAKTSESQKRYESQRKIAEINKNTVLKSLLEHPKTFTDLKTEIPLSRQGLTNVLNRMIKDDFIKHVQYSRTYELTSNGKKNAKAIPLMLDNIEEIFSKDHNYNTEFGKHRLRYEGITYETVYENKIKFELFNAFNKSVEEKLEDVTKLVGIIPDIVTDKSELKGKMVLAFTIDFDDMKEQFLNRNNKSWLNFGIKWENEEGWSKIMENGDSQ